MLKGPRNDLFCPPALFNSHLSLQPFLPWALFSISFCSMSFIFDQFPLFSSKKLNMNSVYEKWNNIQYLSSSTLNMTRRPFHSTQDSSHSSFFYADFVPTFTEDGLCFTFNADGRRAFVNGTGRTHALRLVLNAEKYEYMRASASGPRGQFATGIKVIIHQAEQHNFQGKGFLVAPGSHTEVWT